MDATERAGYVERWARAMEGQGEPRIAGRIYAHLATATEPYLSLKELTDQLEISKASASLNTRRLLEIGMISRVAVPGARSEHFTADPAAARGMFERAITATRLLSSLADEGVRLQADSDTAGKQSLAVLSEAYAAVADALDTAREGVPTSR